MFESDRTASKPRRARQGFGAVAASLVVHAILTTILVLRLLEKKPPAPAEKRSADEEPRVVARLVLPPSPSRSAGRPRAAPEVPTKTPLLEKKDKISIGPPTARRDRDLLLRKDEDIPKEAQGNGALGSGLTPENAPDRPATQPAPAEAPRVASGNRPLAGTAPSITGSLRRLQDRLERGGGSGLGLGPSGPKVVDGFQYDPQGADFTEWINHLKRELYRNWIAPQAAIMGFRGHVTIGFAVARDGSLLGGEILQASGTSSLDRAARNAVLGSRMLPLPADYAPEVFELRVTFYYNETPRPS